MEPFQNYHGKKPTNKTQKFGNQRKKESSGSSVGKQPVLKQLNMYKNESHDTECLLCNECFLLPENADVYLSHLLCSHHLVIADTHCIADFKGYVDYWRTRLASVCLTDICSVMHAPVKEAGANPHVEGEEQEFFLLSDVLPEDRLLRQGLQQKRLEWVLQQQQFERDDTSFKRGCLICRTELTGTRAGYLQHLNSAHNLQIGRTANLVFIDELIDQIDQYLNKFQCIYCEKFFPDRLILREHMRKKMHKRINPSNQLFDQYYAVNYLEMGKNWQQVADEKEEPDQSGYTSGSEAADGDVADWGDWNETTSMSITCLFCDSKFEQWEPTLQHLKNNHRFDFASLVSHMDFYQKVKLVNYIRNQVEKNTCIVCEEICDCQDVLLKHMEEKDHNDLPNKDLWDRAEYYFPTEEDDGFLCQLDDGRADDEGTPECVTGEEPDPQLCEAIVGGHLSEVIELRAELNKPVSADITENSANPAPSTKSAHHVTFKDIE